MRLEELPRRLVALGGDEADAHPRLGARERELAHLREHPRLDAAPERAAAHQQVVELERVGRLTHERDADKPIVAVPVGDVRDARLEPGGERGEAAGGEVELVGLLRQLEHARQLVGRRAAGGDPQLERGDERGEVGRGGGDRPPLQLDAHRLRLRRVLRCRAEGVERPQVGDERVLQGRLRRQQHGARAGARALHVAHLDRVVVDEDNRLQLGEPELGRRRGDVGALGLPVLLVQHEVVVRERPLGVRREGRADVRRHVLAAGDEHQAALLAALERRLQRQVGDERLGAVLAHDAAPERVVAVDARHLERAARHVRHEAHREDAERAVQPVAVRNRRELLGARVKLGRPGGGGQVGDDHLAQPRAVHAPRRRRRLTLRADDDAERRLRRGRGVVPRERGPQLRRVRDVLRPHEEHVDPRGVPVEELRRAEQALHHLAEARVLEPQLAADPRRRRAQVRLAGLEREAARQRERERGAAAVVGNALHGKFAQRRC